METVANNLELVIVAVIVVAILVWVFTVKNRIDKIHSKEGTHGADESVKTQESKKRK